MSATRLARAHSSRDPSPAGLATIWANRSATSRSESSIGSARANGSSCERVGRAVSGALPAAGGCMAPMVWWQSCVTASRSLEAMGVSPPGLCDSSGGAVQLSRISSSASCCSSRWAEPAPPPTAPDTYLRADGAAPFRGDGAPALVPAPGGDGALWRSTACTSAISLVESVRSEGCSQKAQRLCELAIKVQSGGAIRGGDVHLHRVSLNSTQSKYNQEVQSEGEMPTSGEMQSERAHSIRGCPPAQCKSK
jgi:hypothetical protein